MDAEPTPRWRPIAEAPRDGTEFLAWDGADMAIVMWHAVGGTGFWDVVHDAECYAWADYTPTHWLPLPAPPDSEA